MYRLFVFLLFFLLLPACSLFRGGEPDAKTAAAEDSTGPVGGESPAEAAIEDLDGEDIEYIDEEDIEEIEGFSAEDVIDEEFPEAGESEQEDMPVLETGGAEGQEGEDPAPLFSPPDQELKPELPVKKWIPLKKIKTTPYSKAGFLVNAVYIARAGEELSSISQKIFNSDQTAQLLAVNPFLNRRSLKVGDKIYYQSPSQPDRKDKLLFYFEDQGHAPKYYEIQSGQNIRTAASQLLGDADSWKEIWATNSNLESKGILERTVTVQYWDAGDLKNKASDNPLSEPPVSDSAPDSPPPSEPESREDKAENSDLPPAPEEETPPLEDGPPAPDSPPPPEETDDMDMEAAPADESTSSGLQMDLEAGLWGLLALIGLLLAFIFIKKRKKKVEYDFTATNFEIDDK